MRKIKDKRAAYEYVAQETPHRSIQEIADALGVKKQRAHQIQKELGITSPFKRMSDAMAEIRRLKSLLDSHQGNVVAG